MWQETKHGLYKQFNFRDFAEAFAFMTKVAALAEQMQHHPRWENEWSVVQIWLITHDAGSKITDKDRALAQAIDGLLKEGVSVDQWTAAPADPKQAPKRVKLYSDGGSRGNPGPSASGFVLLDMNDKILVDEGVYMGVTTNNQAEYTALKMALEAALKLGAREVDAYLDSLLVVNQMRGVFKIKNRDLWPVHDAIKSLVKQFDSVHFTHVPREHNKLADAAVNRALDEHLGITHENTTP
ncbi:MAG: Ribonuclease [Candidatus Saccharibacteria bacterium]|nr:Ribonuclease [Candidatus Saccharibacteria bacterium]